MGAFYHSGEEVVFQEGNRGPRSSPEVAGWAGTMRRISGAAMIVFQGIVGPEIPSQSPFFGSVSIKL
jgi:hypothetical protein